MMEDITPLNLEDQPKLFGMRYDQLIAVLISLLLGSQLYSWLNPIPFLGHDLRLDLTILIMIIGPAYALITLAGPSASLEPMIESFFSPSLYVPGPDPSPKRFLSDEDLPDFID